MALELREPHRMAQHDRASRAETGWRVPRDGRTSGMSEKTSRSGRGCGLMRGGLHARVLGHGGVPGKRGPTGNTTLALVLGLLCNLFPKTEWPWIPLIILVNRGTGWGNTARPGLWGGCDMKSS